MKQAAFHPLTSHHLLLLLQSASSSSSSSSSSSLLLYDLTQDLDAAEQTVPLPSSSCTAFCFSVLQGWERFTVYLAMADGRIASVCPLLPVGAVLAAEELEAMRDAEETRREEAADDAAYQQQSCKLRWLREAWHESGGEREEQLQVARQTTMRALVRTGLEVGAGGGDDSVEALLLLSTTAVQLCRVFAGGRADVLMAVRESEPLWVEGDLSSAVEPSIIPIDTVSLPVAAPSSSSSQPSRSVLALTSPASSAVTLLSSDSAHYLTFPYLPEVVQVLSSPDVNSASLSSLLSSLHAAAFSFTHESVLSGCVIDDVALGKHVLVLTATAMAVHDVGRRVGVRPLLPSVPSSPPVAASSSAQSPPPFAAVIAPYLQKYQRFRLEVPSSAMSLSSPSDLSAFLSLSASFQSVSRNLHSLHSEVVTRLRQLSSSSQTQQTVVSALEADIVTLRHRQALLHERVELAAEVAEVTRARLRRVLEDWAEVREGSSSDAEALWAAQVRERKDDSERERQRVEQAMTRLQQLRALREGGGVGQQRAGEKTQLVMGGAELSRVQSQLAAQTREIEQLMQAMRALQRLRAGRQAALEHQRGDDDDGVEEHSAAASSLPSQPMRALLTH